MPHDYTAWAQGRDFETQTVYERDYLQEKDFTGWFTGLTPQQQQDQAEFDRQRAQAGVEEFREPKETIPFWMKRRTA